MTRLAWIRLNFENTRLIVFVRLFADLVRDSLTEYAYDAELAGLNYSFGSFSLGVYLSVGGYNDKLGLLAEDVLKKAKNLEIKPERIAVMKEQVRDSAYNHQSFNS